MKLAVVVVNPIFFLYNSPKKVGGWLRGKGGSRLEQEGGGKEGPSLLRREAGAAARLLEAAAGSRRSKQQQQRQQTCCLFISTATSRRQPGQLNQRSRGLSSQAPCEDSGQWRVESLSDVFF